MNAPGKIKFAWGGNSRGVISQIESDLDANEFDVNGCTKNVSKYVNSRSTDA